MPEENDHAAIGIRDDWQVKFNSTSLRASWSSGFSLGNLTVMVADCETQTVAIGLLTRQEHRLEPELQRRPALTP